MSRKSLQSEIREYLENREDCVLADPGDLPGEFLVLQMRRIIRFEVINPNGFSPHEKKYWTYYSQPILIDTRIADRLTKRQMESKRDMKLQCIDLVFASDVADVEKVLWAPEAWQRTEDRPERVG